MTTLCSKALPLLLLMVTHHVDVVTLAYQINRQADGRGGSVSKRHFKRQKEHEEVPTFQRSPFDLENFSTDSSSSSSFPVTTVDQLRSVVLDQQKELSQVEIGKYAREQQTSLLTHDVLELMSRRFHENSKPGARTDDAKLALAMEGGGMRGAVSAGMAAAVAALGLTDTIDSIYGSSAGSIIGAYMVSRQMCVDVYVDILPAAKKKFVCKRRMVKSIFSDLVNVLASAMKNSKLSALMTAVPFPNNKEAAPPGMNISFVLDGIMGEDHGVRPLDLEKFRENNDKQPLRVVASCIDSQDNMFSTCFGTEDFYDSTAAERTDGKRNGLFACLEASVTVPGATGPPLELKLERGNEREVFPCFDAFCFEPLPYRSAVEEGATHVMVLCSRPEGFEPKTKPGAYEKGIAPWYFRSHGHEEVAKFFEKGGQQYIYAEDLLLLEQGKTSSSKVLVPPPEVLYASPETQRNQELIENRAEEWNSAYLLPVKVPVTTPELPTLEQDEDVVLEAVRGGFAAAYDILAPIVGLDDTSTTGDEAARLVFPDRSVEAARRALETTLNVPGDLIFDDTGVQQEQSPLPVSSWNTYTNKRFNDKSHTLLMSLPGFKDGRFGHLAKDLSKGLL